MPRLAQTSGEAERSGVGGKSSRCAVCPPPSWTRPALNFVLAGFPDMGTSYVCLSGHLESGGVQHLSNFISGPKFLTCQLVHSSRDSDLLAD